MKRKKDNFQLRCTYDLFEKLRLNCTGNTLKLTTKESSKIRPNTLQEPQILTKMAVLLQLKWTALNFHMAVVKTRAKATQHQDQIKLDAQYTANVTLQVFFDLFIPTCMTLCFLHFFAQPHLRIIKYSLESTAQCNNQIIIHFSFNTNCNLKRPKVLPDKTQHQDQIKLNV